MALAARTWKYVGSAAVAANTVAGILDALYSLCTSVTYYNGAARTPGSGVAVTGVQHQVTGTTECIDITPIAQTHGVRYLFSGSASVRSPTFVSGDTWSANCIYLGFSRSWNTYNVTGNGWDQALPGSSGSSFTGYIRVFQCGSLTATRVHLFECADGIIVAIQQAAGVTFIGCGLDIDTRVTAATSPLSAEATTGGRYLMWNTSSAAVAATNFNNSNGNQVPFSGNTNNTARCLVLSPGGVSLTACYKDGALANVTDTTSFINADGDWIPREIEIVSGNCVAIGRLREIRIGPDRKLGDTFSSSGTVRGYALSSHPTTDNDTLWLIA